MTSSVQPAGDEAMWERGAEIAQRQDWEREQYEREAALEDRRG